MLRNIDRQYSVLHIGGKRYRVRFSLNALLCLELTYRPLSELLETTFTEWTIDDVLQLTRAALCSLPENQKAVCMRDFDAVRPSLGELGECIDMAALPGMRLELFAALIDSLPRPSAEVNDTQPTRAFHEGHQRALFVDVMGRPEEEFWSSTNREIADRIDCYLEVQGQKDPPKLVRRYGEMGSGMESI